MIINNAYCKFDNFLIICFHNSDFILKVCCFFILNCYLSLPVYITKRKNSLHLFGFHHFPHLIKLFRTLFLDKRIVWTVIQVIVCIFLSNFDQLTWCLETWTAWERRLFGLSNKLSLLFLSNSGSLIDGLRSWHCESGLTRRGCLQGAVKATSRWFTQSQSVRNIRMSIAEKLTGYR